MGRSAAKPGNMYRAPSHEKRRENDTGEESFAQPFRTPFGGRSNPDHATACQQEEHADPKTNDRFHSMSWVREFWLATVLGREFPFNPWEILRLCRRDSQSLTVPGMWVEGKSGRSWSEAHGFWSRKSCADPLVVEKHNGRMKARCRSDLRVREREPMTCGRLKGAEQSPAGPSGLGPLHLCQASGFAGGR